ncbi:hypothetical protein BpHYR1_038000 [Brachionus plicatilis]|uniref:Uncharacterized protein n=1 Tax=Brachionus plicatilis TaxID=10195 RepID=A0A3M7QZI6_BRAPC|nr:hypothetical protein BpHYR1_038000 [Brachionus plicatilis]
MVNTKIQNFFSKRIQILKFFQVFLLLFSSEIMREKKQKTIEYEKLFLTKSKYRARIFLQLIFSKKPLRPLSVDIK